MAKKISVPKPASKKNRSASKAPSEEIERIKRLITPKGKPCSNGPT